MVRALFCAACMDLVGFMLTTWVGFEQPWVIMPTGMIFGACGFLVVATVLEPLPQKHPASRRSWHQNSSATQWCDPCAEEKILVSMRSIIGSAVVIAIMAVLIGIFVARSLDTSFTNGAFVVVVLVLLPVTFYICRACSRYRIYRQEARGA